MDQKFCTTIMSADPRKSLRPRESHPWVIPDDPGLSRIKTWVMPSRPSPDLSNLSGREGFMHQRPFFLPLLALPG